MTYTSDDPLPRTANQLLANKGWRRLNSWWILPPVLSFGFLGWLGFFVAAIRTGKKIYWIFTGVYALFLAVGITLIELDPNGLIGSLGVIPILGCWLAPTVHAAAVNRQYLTALASAKAAKGVWYAAPSHVPEASETLVEAPVLGVDETDFYSPDFRNQPQDPATQVPATIHASQPFQRHRDGASPTGSASGSGGSFARIHANTATIDGLTGLPGVSPSLANRILVIRDARGGYRDIDDLASAANLQPHELIRIRNHLTFDEEAKLDEPRDNNSAQHPRAGRILDL
jgi:DNA uptake protein ComE-like DNA-binding protein